jgi:hypothetical protein
LEGAGRHPRVNQRDRQRPTARQIIKKLLVEPLRFTPREDEDATRDYEFEGEGTLIKMLASITRPRMVASNPSRRGWMITVATVLRVA